MLNIWKCIVNNIYIYMYIYIYIYCIDAYHYEISPRVTYEITPHGF